MTIDDQWPTSVQMSPVSKVRLSAVALSAGITFFKPVLNLQILCPIVL